MDSAGTNYYIAGDTSGDLDGQTNAGIGADAFVTHNNPTAVPGAVIVTVPGVVGSSQAAATTDIEDAGLVVAIIESFDPAVPVGNVISQSPAAGSSVAEGSTVTLNISLGPQPATVSVPGVVGLLEAVAVAAIEDAGLVAAINLANDPVVPDGDVISQSPSGGTTVDTGSTVTITVSIGPDVVLTIVPDVTNTPLADAEASIGALLIVGTITEEFSPAFPVIIAGNVISTTPSGGALVNVGTTVDIVVSLGLAPISTPDVLGLPQADAEVIILAADLVVGVITPFPSDTVPVGNVISQDPLVGFPVVAGTEVDLTISSGPAAPPPPPPPAGDYSYYVLNPLVSNGSMSVVSLVDGNTITAGGTTLNLDQGNSGTIPSGDLGQGTQISGTGSFDIGGNVDDTDMPVPSAFAGTEFVIPHYRNTHLYYLMSPNGSATATVNVGGAITTLNLTQGNVVEFNAGTSTAISGIVTSDNPILMAHRAAEGYDASPVAPATTEVWGIRSNNITLGASQDNTTITLYASDGSSTTVNLDAGDRSVVAVGSSGSEGAGNAIHIVADAPIGVFQNADSDGFEQTNFWSSAFHATEYALPVDTQYVAIACPSANTTITLNDGGTSSQTCSAIGNTPGKAYFGSTTDGTNINAGATISSDQPIYLYYEASSTSDEHNLLGNVSFGPPPPPPPANVPPTAGFSSSCTDLTCSFTDSSTDSDGSIVAYAWSFGDGNTSSAQNPSRTYGAAGTYTVSLTVTDNAGATDTTSGTVTVTAPPPPPANVAPTAAFSSSCTDLSCSFTDSSTDSDGSIVAYAWSFGDGNTSSAQDPSHTYGAANTYTVSLTVTDDAGATDSASSTVTVTAPPVPNVVPTAGFSSSCTDLTCSFTDSSTDSDGSIVAYAWSFGDGNTSSAQDPSHTYGAANTYTVSLTVTDDAGATDSASSTVTVTAPPPPPPPAAGDYAYYVLNPFEPNGDMEVVSLSDGNTITAGGTTLNLDNGQSGTIPASDIDQGTRVAGTGPFDIGSTEDSSDMPVPSGFASTSFVIPHYRDSHLYYLMSPNANASVSINIDGSVSNINLTQGVVVEFDAGGDNTISGLISADQPILMAHRAVTTSDRDAFPVPPPALEVWGIYSNNVIMGALEDGTTITVYASDGTSGSYALDAGGRTAAFIGSSGSEGAGNALHIVADRPIMVQQGADSDGFESVGFWEAAFHATEYALPVDTQYVAIACPSAGTTITLNDGGSISTQTCSASGNTPGKAYFGSTTDGANINAGATISSDQPIYLYYEEASNSDEHNLLGNVSFGPPPPPPANVAPTAAFSGSCTDLTCSFTDGSSDSDGSIVAYAWSFGDGAASSAQNPLRTYAAAGTYTVSLTVTDDGGATDTTSSSVTVTALPPPPANVAPTAAFSSNCTDLSCAFTDGSSDSDGSIATYAWSFGDGATSSAQDPSHTYGAANTYTVSLTVTDDVGATDSASSTVTVTAPPVPNVVPTAAFSSNCTDLSCSFTDGSSDSDGSIVTYAWSFGDGATSSAQDPSRTYGAAGTYTVSLTVTDDGGATDTTSSSVTVTAPPPPPPPPGGDPVEVFYDSFENGQWDGLWTEDAQNDWFTSTQRDTSGSSSAEVDGSASDAQLISTPIDLQGGTQASITFNWYIESGLDTGEYLAFDVSTDGGASWTEYERLRGNVDSESTWHSEQVDLSGISSLRLRFRARMSWRGEDANVDEVRVTVQ